MRRTARRDGEAEDDREQAKWLLADLASIIMTDARADGLTEAQAKLLGNKLASRVGSAWESARWKSYQARDDQGHGREIHDLAHPGKSGSKPR